LVLEIRLMLENKLECQVLDCWRILTQPLLVEIRCLITLIQIFMLILQAQMTLSELVIHPMEDLTDQFNLSQREHQAVR